MSKRILILGGGFGGMFAAREIRKRLGQAVDVELINADNYFMFQPLLPEVAAGSISRSRRDSTADVAERHLLSHGQSGRRGC